ncbi:hypothetical protein FXE18_09550 [Vibrio cholerae]|nr:hypothetical protein [Vibrio cholerae]TXX77230.1 hypothetical protein FXE96_05730 [Vibrio cholerae]TYA66578.1 hypothetical protein FXE18_09550 [Vibrio cholerae]
MVANAPAQSTTISISIFFIQYLLTFIYGATGYHCTDLTISNGFWVLPALLRNSESTKNRSQNTE